MNNFLKRVTATFFIVFSGFLLISIKAQEAASNMETHSVKGIKLKGKAPVNKEPLKVKFPAPQTVALSNGLKILLQENHTAPTFTMQLLFPNAGGASDPVGKKGTASYTASLLRGGTTKMTSREIAEQLDTIGSILLPRSTPYVAAVNAFGVTENFEKTLGILSDIVRNPVFPDEEVEKQRGRLQSVVLLFNSNPDAFTNEQLNKIVYGEHPSAFINPPEASIKTFKAEDLIKFHSTYYRPNNAVLAVVGDITMPELKRLVENAFGDWQKGDLPPIEIPPVKAPIKTSIHLFDRPTSVQTTLLLGSLGVERSNPDFYPLIVLSQILGGGPTGRLFMNLREDKGYTYGAYSSFGASNVPGLIRINTSVRNEVTEGALKELMFEVKRINDEKVLPIELENAKHAIIGKFALSLDNPQVLLADTLDQNIYNLPANYWNIYADHINAVSAEDLQRVARKYLSPETLQIVAVGNAAQIRPILEKYGKVEVTAEETLQVPTELRRDRKIQNQ